LTLNIKVFNVIFVAICELNHYLTSRKEKLYFVKSEYEIDKNKTYEVRKMILDISFFSRNKLGLSEEILHNTKQKTKAISLSHLKTKFLRGSKSRRTLF
jgi:hypothetical protein